MLPTSGSLLLLIFAIFISVSVGRPFSFWFLNNFCLLFFSSVPLKSFSILCVFFSFGPSCFLLVIEYVLGLCTFNINIIIIPIPQALAKLATIVAEKCSLFWIVSQASASNITFNLIFVFLFPFSNSIEWKSGQREKWRSDWFVNCKWFLFSLEFMQLFTSKWLNSGKLVGIYFGFGKKNIDNEKCNDVMIIKAVVL